MRCAVLLLSYNGLGHVRTAMPSLTEAAREVSGGCRVVVVDNRSNDGTPEWLRANYPDVECVVTAQNDCLFSLNSVVAACSEDIVVVVNNDMRFDRRFVAALLPHFDDQTVFAVTAHSFDWDGHEPGRGCRLGQVERFWFYRPWSQPCTKACPTLYADGASAAYRRSMFVELGGFDTLYRPGYFEDTDLSYRAWRRGWQVIYEPASVVYHRRGATFDHVQGRRAITRLIARNEVLFTLRNVGTWTFVAGYLTLMPWRVLRNVAAGRVMLATGMTRAVPRIPRALLDRYRDSHMRQRSDTDFLAAIRANAQS